MKYKVLIVDDEMIIRQGIEYMIDWNAEQCEIIGKAGNGLQAFEMVKNLQPDVVISDVVMPEMDGIELTRQLQQQYPDIKVIILSAYSDYDYVRSTFTSGAVDYILKPALSPVVLRESLHKVLSLIPRNNATGILSASTQLSRLCMGYEVKLDHLQFCKGSWLLFSTDQNLLKKETGLLALIEQDFLGIPGISQVYSFDLPSSRQGILLCIDSGSSAFDSSSIALNQALKTKLSDALLTVFRKKRPVLPISSNQNPALSGSSFQNQTFQNDPLPFTVLSLPFEDPDNIQEVYEEQIIPVFARRFYLKNAVLTQITDLPASAKADTEPLPLKKFMELVGKGNFSEAFSLLEVYIQEALENWQKEADIKNFVSSAVYYFIGVLEEARLQNSHLQMLKLNCMTAIQSAEYKENFVQEVKRVLDDFSIILESYKVEKSREEIRRIEKYMKDHLSEPLQLQTVADHFGFSYHYFSSLFSSRKGETFVEYLNRIRIEKACSLLCNTSLSMAEIALECGYSDSNYFSKVFKKQTGLTPRQYRKETC